MENHDVSTSSPSLRNAGSEKRIESIHDPYLGIVPRLPKITEIKPIR